MGAGLQGLIMQAEEWRERTWNDVGTIDNDEGVVEVSLSNITRFGSPQLQVRACLYPQHQLIVGVFIGVFLFACCFVLWMENIPF